MRKNEVICDRCGATQSINTKNDIIISFAKIDLVKEMVGDTE